jgi:hypothetical protein
VKFGPATAERHPGVAPSTFLANFWLRPLGAAVPSLDDFAMCRYVAFVVVLLAASIARADSPRAALPRVQVTRDAKGFVVEKSGAVFTPWGFNYDHDEKGRLIEDYWADEWTKIEADFREMKELGANVVRVHLQFGRFMDAADRPNAASLERLAKLLTLAEDVGLYLDLTGLGCYHKKDVPAWYDRLDEKGRWAAQARFWEAIAAGCAASPAVFCYDLMNEPVVAAGGPKTAWLGPAFAGKHFVQYITLDSAGRKREEIAAAWIKMLSAAIRKRDKQTLVTVGLVPWSLDRPKRLYSGFDPKRIAPEVDFIAVHLYPESGKLDEAIETLQAFSVGKPVVIEETFPLKCSAKEFETFLTRSREHAAGWVGFYWGETPAELRRKADIPSAMMLNWLEIFQRHHHRDAPERR